MQRVGYDADTQTYTYRDNSNGGLWEGEPGNRYGELHRAGLRPPPSKPGISARRRYEDWRYLLPFFVLVGVFLLLVFLLVDRGGEAALTCDSGWEAYRVVNGDTCWGIAEGRGVSVGRLEDANPGLECDYLEVGGRVCVPLKGDDDGR